MEPNQQEVLPTTEQDEPAREAPVVPVESVVQQSEAVEDDVQNEEDDATDGEQPLQLPQVEPVRWQALEYVQYAKQPIWYVGFAVVVVVLIVLAVWLMQSWTFAVLILVMAAALMVYSHRPPRDLSYVLSEKGLHINDQLHPMGDFKAFGVVRTAETNSLMLIPVKRFRPGLSVYFPAEVGERAVDLLGSYLPMQDIKLDAFDTIVQKLHL